MLVLLLVGFGITVVSFLGGFLPTFCLKERLLKYQGRVNSCCAGIFLATVFLHLLPELMISFVDIQNQYKGGRLDFAYVFYAIPVGFLATLLLELLVHRLLSGHSHNHSDTELVNVEKNLQDKEELSEEKNSCDSEVMMKKVEKGIEDSGVDLDSSESPKMGQLALPSVEKNSTLSASDDVNSVEKNSTMSVSLSEDLKPTISENKCEVSVETGNISVSEKKPTEAAAGGANFVRIGTLLVAIGIHSVLEGFTLGIQDTDTTIFMLGMALGLHKFPEAFTYAAQTARGLSSTAANFLNLVVYSLMTPLGMLFGHFLKNLSIDGYEKDLSLLLVEATGTGTFLFIFFELLDTHITLTEFLYMVGGFIIAGIAPFLEATVFA